MCVQDWNIPQSYESIRREITLASSSDNFQLPPNKARTGIVICGPTTSTLTLAAGAPGNASRLATIQTGQDQEGRIWLLNREGPIVQDLLDFSAGAAASFVLYEYLWVLNPEQRKHLAETGGF